MLLPTSNDRSPLRHHVRFVYQHLAGIISPESRCAEPTSVDVRRLEKGRGDDGLSRETAEGKAREKFYAGSMDVSVYTTVRARTVRWGGM